MEISRLLKFDDGILIDEIIVENCTLEVLKTGIALYSFNFSDSKENKVLELWTSQKGFIETQIDNKTMHKNLIERDTEGQLKSLKLDCHHFHLEHMDRGHYWMMIQHNKNEKIVLHFMTRGYLKTKLIQAD